LAGFFGQHFWARNSNYIRQLLSYWMITVLHHCYYQILAVQYVCWFILLFPLTAPLRSRTASLLSIFNLCKHLTMHAQCLNDFPMILTHHWSVGPLSIIVLLHTQIHVKLLYSHDFDILPINLRGFWRNLSCCISKH